MHVSNTSLNNNFICFNLRRIKNDIIKELTTANTKEDTTTFTLNSNVKDRIKNIKHNDTNVNIFVRG